MPSFGLRSKTNLFTCDPDIQLVMLDVVRVMDCTILEGYRPKEKQDAMYLGRPQRSKLAWPKSKHNVRPSNAVDVAPWIAERGRGNEIPWPKKPSNWNDQKQVDAYVRDWMQWSQLAGVIKTCAERHGVLLISGMDWDNDDDYRDTNFMDAPHWEKG